MKPSIMFNNMHDFMKALKEEKIVRVYWCHRQVLHVVSEADSTEYWHKDGILYCYHHHHHTDDYTLYKKKITLNKFITNNLYPAEEKEDYFEVVPDDESGLLRYLSQKELDSI